MFFLWHQPLNYMLTVHDLFSLPFKRNKLNQYLSKYTFDANSMQLVPVRSSPSIRPHLDRPSLNSKLTSHHRHPVAHHRSCMFFCPSIWRRCVGYSSTSVCFVLTNFINSVLWLSNWHGVWVLCQRYRACLLDSLLATFIVVSIWCGQNPCPTTSSTFAPSGKSVIANRGM